MPSEDGSPPCAAPLYCRPCTAPPVLMLYTLYRAPLMLHPAVSSRVAPRVSTLYCPPVLPPLVLPPVRSDRAPLMPYAPLSTTHAVRSIEHPSCPMLHRAPLMLCAPSSTTHAVCHASSRPSRYASCVKLSIDHRRARTIWSDWEATLLPRAKSTTSRRILQHLPATRLARFVWAFRPAPYVYA